MKPIFFLFSLIVSALSVSCTTELPDHDAVSDAWLDTPPRTPQRPARPADGMTHWKTGLPPAGSIRPPVRTVVNEPAVVSEPKDRGRKDEGYVSTGYGYNTGYTTYYGKHYGKRRGYGGHGHHGHRHPSGFVRTVEKVGPSIVPRLHVPERAWTAPQSTHSGYHGKHGHRRHHGDGHKARRGSKKGENSGGRGGDRGGRRR